MSDKPNTEATETADTNTQATSTQNENAQNTGTEACDTQGQTDADAQHPGAETDAEAPQAEAEPELTPEAHIAALESELLRSRADLDNARKRFQKERGELRELAAAGLIEQLLPVLDNFQLGLQAAQQNEAAKDVVTGFTMVQTQLTQMLGYQGLEEMAPKPGDAFDANQHDAASTTPSAEHPAQHIVQVIRPGYKLGARLIRPATVVVSSGAETADASETEAEASE